MVVDSTGTCILIDNVENTFIRSIRLGQIQVTILIYY